MWWLGFCFSVTTDWVTTSVTQTGQLDILRHIYSLTKIQLTWRIVPSHCYYYYYYYYYYYIPFSYWQLIAYANLIYGFPCHLYLLFRFVQASCTLVFEIMERLMATSK